MGNLVKIIRGCCFIVVYFFIPAICSDPFFPWTPANGTRQDLLCPNTCRDDQDTDACCSCDAGQCWEFEDIARDSHWCNTTVANLYVEQTDVLGNSVVINDTESGTGFDTFYRLVHQDGILQSLPANLCEYPNLVYVDLSGNLIDDISSIKCLSSLNTLYLQNNPISVLPADIFRPLENLRTLDMSDTKVSVLEPWALETGGGPILNVNMSRMNFKEFDITNILGTEITCIKDFCGSTIPEMSNKDDFKMQPGHLYGGGTVSLTNTHLSTFPNFTLVGLSDYSSMNLYLHGKFRLSDAEVHCDCKLLKLLKSLAFPEVARIWPDANQDFICASPESMQGISFDSFDISSIYDRFVCDIGVDCPSRCTCKDMPHQEVVQVNCSGAGLTEMPDFMPTGYWNNKQLEIIMDNNYITHFEEKPYFDRIKNITMANNPIDHISATALGSLPENTVVNLTGNGIKRIPSTAQRMSPWSLNLGNTTLVCDCENTWMGDWLRAYNATGTVFCEIGSDSVVDGHALSDALLNCKTSDNNEIITQYIITGVISFVGLMLIAGGIVVARRYKHYVLILYRRLFVRYESLLQMAKHFDVFVSYDVEDRQVRQSVRTEILDGLNSFGYTTYCPFTSPILASSKDENIALALDQSAVFLVVFSSGYLREEETSQQFKLLWEAFRQNRNKKLIAIDVSDMSVKDVNCSRMKALLKVGGPLDFKPTNDKVLTRLRECLGPPRARDLFELNPRPFKVFGTARKAFRNNRVHDGGVELEKKPPLQNNIQGAWDENHWAIRHPSPAPPFYDN